MRIAIEIARTYMEKAIKELGSQAAVARALNINRKTFNTIFNHGLSMHIYDFNALKKLVDSFEENSSASDKSCSTSPPELSIPPSDSSVLPHDRIFRSCC